MCRFRFAIVIALLLPFPSPGTAAEGDAASNWAVIAARPADQGIADLLAANLSQIDGMRLVERSAIATWLDELKLNANGLIDPENATRFGQLATADAIVVVESVEPAGTQRVRLIETRTGVRLADELAPPGDPDEQCAEIARRLSPMRGKLQLRDEARRYVGVVGLRSEEPGSALDATARTLSVLLEHDLRKLPDVVVLEREQLSRLTAEADLTGVELKLRASAVLIEGGLRRNGENGDWLFSFRLLPLAGGQAKESNTNTKPEVPTARDAVLAAMAAALRATQTDMPATSPAELKAEALLLATRAQWLVSHDSYLEAAPLAEAALALDPDRKWYYKTMAIYNRLSSDSRRSRLDRLHAALRGNQIDQQYLNLALRTSPGAEDYPTGYMLLCCFKPVDMSAAERQILDETRRLQNDKFDLLLTERRKHHLSATGLIVVRLKKSFYFTDSAEQFVTEVRAMVEELDRETNAGNFPRTLSDGWFSTFFGHMQRILRAATEVHEQPTNLSAPLDFPGNWGPERIAPLLQWLAGHDDPGTRMLGLYGLASQADRPGAEAARGVLDLWLNELTPHNTVAIESVAMTVEQAARRLHKAGEFVPWFEQVLARAEATQDASNLVRRSSPLRQCLFNVDSSKTVAWTERVIALLDAEAYDPSLTPRAKELKTSLSMGIDNRLKRGRYARPTATGWDKYDVRELKLDGRTGDMEKLEHAIIDRTPGANQPIVMVWRGSPRLSNAGTTSGDVIVARISARGGKLSEVGRFRTDKFGTTSLAVSAKGDVALGSRSSGVAVVSPRGIKRFTSEHGLPDASVEGTAWLNGKLYLAFPGAIGRLDVESGKFTLLASSKAVQQNSPLDGGSMYEIPSLIADPDRDCVWLSIEERIYEHSRGGIWQITAEGKIHHAYAGQSGPLSWTDDGFFFMPHTPGNSPLPWSIFNVETGETQTLRDLEWFYPDRIHHPPGWAYIAGDIIHNIGYVSTPGDHRYQHATARWNQPLGRLGVGLICASFDTPRLWYIEPHETR
ncbi:MAG: hypothetical protein ABI614_10330 [Planctomycetota bacterium]